MMENNPSRNNRRSVDRSVARFVGTTKRFTHGSAFTVRRKGAPYRTRVAFNVAVMRSSGLDIALFAPARAVKRRRQ